MAYKKDIDEATVKAVIVGYKKGASFTKIADFLGIGKSTVIRILREHKIPFRERGRAQTKTDRNALILRRHAEGASLKEIADETDLSKARVHFIIERGY